MEDKDGVPSCRPEARGTTYTEVYSVTPEAAGVNTSIPYYEPRRRSCMSM